MSELSENVSTRKDRVLAPGIGIYTFTRDPREAMSTSVVTRSREDGGVDLIAIIHQSLPVDEREATQFIVDQSFEMSHLFERNEGNLNLSTAQKPFSQKEITELAIASLRQAAFKEDSDALSRSESVVKRTAVLWKLLKQFGSSKPAEVLAEYFKAKPRTINARLAAAREQGILPPVERARSTKTGTSKEGSVN